MAFTVTLYQFQKRKNSTLQPSALQGVELSCELKQPTSYKNPVFTFFVEAGFEWNYLKWDSWYYFITDVVSVRNSIFEVHCKLDVLATYKTEIGATSAFVLYDTTGNTEIIDNRLSQRTTATLANADGTSRIFESGMCVCVGIVGRTSAGIFAMTPGTASTLLNSINNWLDVDMDLEIPSGGFSFSDWNDAVNDAVKYFVTAIRQLIATGKAPDSIKSAIILPISISRFTGSSETIYLGDYDTNIQAVKLTANQAASDSSTVSIPWQATDWRRNAPYHSIYLYLPYAGMVSIPPSEVIGDSSLNITTYVSVNGTVNYKVTAGSKVIGRYSGTCGSSFMIGASNINPLSSLGSITAGVGAAAGVLAASTGVGAAAVGAAGIVGMLTGVQPLQSAIGSGGGGAWTDGPLIQCFTIYHNTNVEPSSVAAAIGTPAMSVKTIGSLSGFVQTREASVDASCYEDVRTEINSLMDGGFFYE